MYLPNASTEHDGLQPLAPLAVGQAHAEGAGVALDEWLSKLVAVVRGPIRGVDQNLRAAQSRRMGSQMGRTLNVCSKITTLLLRDGSKLSMHRGR